MREALGVDDLELRHRRAVEQAWADFDDPRDVTGIEERSAMVSTNRVYRLVLADGTSVFAKSSNYGSFFLFAEDHDRLDRVNRLLAGGRYGDFLANALHTADGRPYVWYDGETWVVFYAEIAIGHGLPRRLSDAQVQRLGHELASFHLACAEIAPQIPPPSKTAKSDAVNLYERLASRNAHDEFGLDQSRIDLVRRHTHRFLMAVHESGYDTWTKMPVLIDWNLGNFSVQYGEDDADFTLFSRWDYDWFRIESRLLDFYFLSRVSSSTGDRSVWTYGSHTLLEPRFRLFLDAYHQVFPLTADEVLFLKEAYRFFLLNYVVREGRHFFRYEFWQHLMHDAVDVQLPELDALDLTSLLSVVD